jgi:hypothetical protein
MYIPKKMFAILTPQPPVFIPNFNKIPQGKPGQVLLLMKVFAECEEENEPNHVAQISVHDFLSGKLWKST